MRILVLGGAGYIGSHTALELIRAGHEVLVVDNLVRDTEKLFRNRLFFIRAICMILPFWISCFKRNRSMR